MTTTVTVRTFDNPARVSLHESLNEGDDYQRADGWQTRTNYQPRNSERDYTVTGSASISINELPADQDSLNTGSDTLGNTASAR